MHSSQFWGGGLAAYPRPLNFQNALTPPPFRNQYGGLPLRDHLLEQVLLAAPDDDAGHGRVPVMGKGGFPFYPPPSREGIRWSGSNCDERRRFEVHGLPGLVVLMNHSSVQDFLMSSSHPHSSEELIGLRHPIFREGITRCTHFMMVARYLERCADHASKIAGNVHYMATHGNGGAD